MSAGAEAKLRRLSMAVFATLFDNRDYICVIADVLTNYRRKGAVPVERVRAHTDGLVRALRRLVAEGVESGEIRATVNPDRAAAVLYSQFEAAALRMAVTGNADLAASVDAMDEIMLALRP